MAPDWRPRGFAVEQLLGTGGSAQVWRARVAATGEQVALKRIHTQEHLGRAERSERAARAKDEAALLAALAHPNLVRLRAVAVTREDTVLVLDLAERGSLRDLLAARGRLTAGEVVTALHPIAAALSYLHSRSVVHGDVSPANILFTADGTPVLADVGVARLTGDDRDAESTPAYADPSVAAGEAPGPASDVFMLGAVAFHALTGAPLWHGGSPIALLADAVGGVPGDVADRLTAAGAPRPVTEVVCRALVTERSQRISPVELALDLRHSTQPQAVEFGAGRVGAADVEAGGGRRPPGTYPARASGAAPLPLTPPAMPPPGPPPVPVPPPGLPPVSVPLPVPPPAARARLVLPRPGGRHARRRARRRRPSLRMVVSAAVVVALAAVVTPAVLGTEPSRQRRTAARSASAGAGPQAVVMRWQRVLDELDAVRALAYATRRPDLLTRVYADRSLLARDQAQLRRSVPPGCGLDGAHTGYRSLTPVPAGPRMVITVVATMPATQLTCRGVTRATAPGIAAQRLRIVIVSTARGPLIAGQSTA